MFGLISSDGLKMLSVFIKSCQKVDTNEHIRTLENHVKPWIDVHYSPGDNVVFLPEDPEEAPGEPVKTLAKRVMAPGSPDLSPLDYSI